MRDGLKGQLGGNSHCSDILDYFWQEHPQEHIVAKYVEHRFARESTPSLRDSGQPFATGISCLCWRPLLMGRTLDEPLPGPEGR